VRGVDPNVSSDRIAVLIDGENTRAAYADEVLSEVAKYGNPTIKRVYGDWTNSHLGPWARRLNSLGLRAMHQNAFTKSKNSSDLALVIDAMDLLYDDNVEAFALVTSDSDFTSLAHRLRESGKTVYVLGEKKAPDALKNACDKFIDLEVVQDGKKSDVDEPVTGDQDDSDDAPAPTINLQSALTRAINAVADDDGWASLGLLGNQLNRTYPSFDARSFGDSGTRLSTLVADQPYLETSGSGNAMRVRRKGAAKTAAKETGKAAKVVKEPRAPRTTRARKATKATEVAETTETTGTTEPAETAAARADVPKVTTTTRAARKASSTKAAATKAAATKA
jgi:uncharacterized protein (TIGR00288 family)